MSVPTLEDATVGAASTASAGASPARRTAASGSDDGARDDRIGWRLTSVVPNDPVFEIRLDATRREPDSGNAPPEHGAIDTGGTNERYGCNGASAAHAVVVSQIV